MLYSRLYFQDVMGRIQGGVMIDAQEFIVYATFLVVMIIWIEIKGMD